MDESNQRDLDRKNNQVETSKAKTEHLGAVIHKNNLLLRLPMMGMTLTLRPSTTACEGLQSLPAEGQWAASISLQPGQCPHLQGSLSQGSEWNNVPQLKASAVSSVDLLFLLSKKNCRWKSVVVFGKRINKIFDSESLWGT